jgi:hypothetical protein
MLIFLMEACQFIFNDCFDLLIRILLLIIVSFGLFMLSLLQSVQNRRLCLGCWLFWWLFRSSSFDHYWTKLYGCMWLGGCFEGLVSSR